MSTTDAALLNRWSDRRDAEAFSELISRHGAMVHGTCLRLLRNVSDAEDVTQECFLKLSRKRNLGSSHVGGWLHRVAMNSCLDKLRVESRRERREKAYVETSRPVQEQTWDDIKPFVDEAIASLDDDLRAPVVLHFLEDQTHKATAAALGLKRATTTRRIHRGVEQIRENLKSKGLTVGAMTLATLFEANASHAISTGLMGELKKIALTGSGTASKGLPSHPLLAARGLLLIAAGLCVMALIAGSVAFVSRGASQTIEPGNTPAPPSASVAAVVLPVENTPITPPMEPVQAQAPPAEQAPIVMAQALDEPEDSLLLYCVDVKGEPVEGAEVYLVHDERKISGMRMATSPEEQSRTGYGPFLSDSNGIASLPHIDLPEDSIPYNITDSYTAYARLPGKLVGAWRYMSAQRSEPDWNHLILVESMQIQGTVSMPAGFKPPDVSVKVMTLRIQDGKSRFGSGFSNSEKFLPSLWPELFVATPDETGEFVLNDIPMAGAYYLAATGEGLGEKQFFSRNPETDFNITIEMKAEGMIEGTLRYSSGAGVLDVAVLARPSGRYRGNQMGNTSPFITRTDQNGRFKFRGLPEESYNVYTYPLGNPHEWVAPVIEDVVTEAGFVTQAVDLWFERGVVVEGQVLEEVSGDPVPDVMIVAMNPGDGQVGRGESLGSVLTDLDGRYRVLVPRAGTWFYFGAVPRGHVYPKDQAKRTLSLLPGESQKLGFDFTLKADPKAGQPVGLATVKGQVLNPDGNPLEGVVIKDEHNPGQGALRSLGTGNVAKSGADGRFTFKVMATGKHRIHVGGDGYSISKSEWVTPKKDEVVELPDAHVVLFTKALSGTLIDAAGNLLSEVPLYLSSEESGSRETKSDARGEFIFEHVPDGPLRLFHMQPMQNPLYKEFFEEVEGGFHYDIVMRYFDDPDEEP